jgi:hypothetical protein
MPRAGYYSPTQAEELAGKVEQHLKLAKHHTDCIRRAVQGCGPIPVPLDEVEATLERVAGELCELVDDRTEREMAGVGG